MKIYLQSAPGREVALYEGLFIGLIVGFISALCHGFLIWPYSRKKFEASRPKVIFGYQLNWGKSKIGSISFYRA